MFREPLTPTVTGHDYSAYLSSLGDWQKSTHPFTKYELYHPTIPSDSLGDVASRLNETERGLVVAGPLRNRLQGEQVKRLAQKLAWPTLPDITSGLRLGASQPPVIPYYDTLLLSDHFAGNARPEVILHLGGNPVSKRLADYLERSRPLSYLLVNDHPFRQDPSHRVTQRVEAEVGQFCESLLPLLRKREESGWLGHWHRASERVARILNDFVTSSRELNEPLVARLVSERIGSNHCLFLAASMPVRDLDTHAATSGSEVPVAYNRGVSGIDGILATASGYAQGLQRPITVLMGDLAFLHDLNSLNLLRTLDHTGDGGGAEQQRRRYLLLPPHRPVSRGVRTLFRHAPMI